MMPQQQSQAGATPNHRPPETRDSGGSTADAPPKQVSQAMDRLAHSGRLIADIRLGADRLLEALFVSAQPHQSNKPLDLFMKEDASIRQHLQDLRTIEYRFIQFGTTIGIRACEIAMASSGSDSKFLGEKFDGKKNSSLWQIRMRDLLVQQDVVAALDEKEKKPKDMNDKKWDDIDSRAVSSIRLCLTDDVVYDVMAEKSAHVLWKKLEDLYMGKNYTNRLILKQELYNFQRKEGRQLEDSGVLNESLRSRSNSWGLHMPLVCPDGAVVAYAWKRQLAGQAGASAVDRTRLALKAFTDQKRRFFPHLDDVLNEHSSGTEPALKKYRGSQLSTIGQHEDLSDCRTLSDVLTRLEKEEPNIKVSTYQRLDWLKRAALLSSSANENSSESSKEHNFHSSNKLRSGLMGAAAADKDSVIELLVPSVFRAVVSLHPAGSMEPDAVAFFSPDEGGSYIHSRGLSIHQVFRHMTKYAATALQYFLGIGTETSLYFLLCWICSYQTLFTKPCSKCNRLLSMDKQSSLLLPPVHRSYQQFYAIRSSTSQPLLKEQNLAYHVGCISEQV